MALDPATLVTTVVVVLTVLALLLALAWAQTRSVPALGIWAACFGLCAAAAALWGERSVLPDFLAIDVANAMRLSALGLGWAGARLFIGRPASTALALAPAALWLAASSLSVFQDDDRLRVAIASLLGGACVLAMAAELWQARRSGVRTALPAAVLLAVHGAFFLGRAIAALLMAHPHLSFAPGRDGAVNPIVIFEALIVAVALAFLLVSVAKERLEMQQREAAHIDPLTGIPNRRGFDAAVERMLARARRDGSFTALLLVDIDHFKLVNDTWGHQAGDCALQAVARTMEQHLRGGDVAARIGGEEFAIALAASRIEQAAIAAERVRRAVAALNVRRGDVPVPLSVSVGVAALRNVESAAALFERADAGLYRAKAGGRNRIELAPALLACAEPENPPRPAAGSRAA